MSPGDQCFRGYGRRNGERRRKSVRGCIVSQDLSVLNLVIVKKGEAELPGLTDEEKPRQRGPKRASKIRKMFNLGKDDDVRHYVKIYGKKVEKVRMGGEMGAGDGHLAGRRGGLCCMQQSLVGGCNGGQAAAGVALVLGWSRMEKATACSLVSLLPFAVLG